MGLNWSIIDHGTIMKTVEFKKETINDHLYRIHGLGDACMYFIHGSSKGLLVDTAYGVGDLKGYIESFWSKPYDVLITHGHADHANGIDQWDEVYMNSKDQNLFATKTNIGLRRTMLRRTVCDIDEYSDDLFHVGFHGHFKELYDGMIFDLGGLHVKAIAAPGHTQGMMTLLLQEDRIILFGDACGVFTFLFKPESSTVAVYAQSLKHLKSYETYYDRVLRQHGTCESPKSVLDENLEVAESILAGSDDHIPFEYLGEHHWLAKAIDPQTGQRLDGKNGNIVYAMNKIR